MSTLNLASQYAIKAGFTHILASDGTLTDLAKCKGCKKQAAYQFIGGIGWIISIPKKRGYYEVVSVINGYQARYNPLYNKFIVSHREIGAGLAEIRTLEEFADYAKRG